MILSLVAAGAGCGGDDEAEIVWTHQGAGLEGQVTSFQGPSHCDQESATILFVDWPSGTAAPDGPQTYVRDPEGVFADISKSRFEADAMLPRAATDTGFSSSLGALWIAQDVGSVVYVRTSDRVEAWPRTRHVVGCD